MNNNGTPTAYQVFDIFTGADIALVRTESQALAYGGTTDYEAVAMSPCYCDSAYHAAGHRI